MTWTDDNPYPVPTDEADRLALVRQFEFLTDPALPDHQRAILNRLCELARLLLGVERAYVSLMSEREQVMIGRANMEVERAPRDLAFCAYTIVQRELMEIPDATQSSRFAQHPFVMGPFALRFYAGIPLEIQGQPIGTFCVVDSAPRQLSENETRGLEVLSQLFLDQARLLLELRTQA